MIMEQQISPKKRQAELQVANHVISAKAVKDFSFCFLFSLIESLRLTETLESVFWVEPVLGVHMINMHTLIVCCCRACLKKLLT